MIGLDLLNTHETAKITASKLSDSILQQAKYLRRFAVFSGVLVATTAISGAYVAGNDAGRAFNSFPKMGDDWIPNEIFDMKPLWKNFFENTALVQFNHRILALSTLATVTVMYAKTIAAKTFWNSLPKYPKIALHAVALMSTTQVGLGISTLLLYVPIPLAAVHQAGSLVLLSFVTCLIHSLRFVNFASMTNKARIVTAAIVTK